MRYLHHLLDSLKSELPAAVELTVFYDQSQSIRDSINDVKLTLLIALILVVLADDHLPRKSCRHHHPIGRDADVACCHLHCDGSLSLHFGQPFAGLL